MALLEISPPIETIMERPGRNGYWSGKNLLMPLHCAHDTSECSKS
jgi:hypothetical protein